MRNNEISSTLNFIACVCVATNVHPLAFKPLTETIALAQELNVTSSY